MDLTSFSERLYSKPGVKNLCLDLQDKHNAKVLILLWCAWLEVQARFVTEDQLNKACELINTASASTVVPLRTLRRSLKATDNLSEEVVRQVQRHILAAELVVERDLLSQLQWQPKDSDVSVSSSGEVAPLSLYWQYLDPRPDEEAKLSILRAAARNLWRS